MGHPAHPGHCGDGMVEEMEMTPTLFDLLNLPLSPTQSWGAQFIEDYARQNIVLGVLLVIATGSMVFAVLFRWE